MGMDLFVYPTSFFHLGAGVFDGALQEGIRTGAHGPRTLFGPPADLYLIGEVGFHWNDRSKAYPGVLRVGAWHHTGTFDRFDGGTNDGSTGYYAIIEQKLWRENPDDEDDAQGFAGFAEYDYAEPDITEIEHHLSAGVTWTGAIASRDDDVIGLGFTAVRFSASDRAGFEEDYEVSLETFFKVQITPNLSLKPDVQYIIDPGGADLDNALVVTLRLDLSM